MGSPLSQPLSAQEWELRRGMSKRLSDFLISHFDDPILFNLYTRYPYHGLYTSPDGYAVRRMYGIADTDEENPCLHMISVMFGMINVVVGGVPLAQVVEVECWTPAQIDRVLCSGIGPEAMAYFLDPLGWMTLVQDMAV